jgi:outer membrane lipoprotein SlyB
MQARGMGGSGMDLVAQMSSAQDANDLEALKSLEREGQAQQLRQGATARMGGMATSLQGRDFEQAAQKAQAADRVAAFNNQLANSTNSQNWNRANSVADRNVGARASFSKDIYNAKQGQGQLDYDYSADTQNKRMLADAEAERKAGGVGQMAGGLVGGVVGGIYGGPGGAQAGGAAGGMVGQSAGADNYRNQRYKSDEACKENIRNEHPMEIEAFLDSLSPKSFDYKDGEGKKNSHGVIAQDLEKSNIGRGIVIEDEQGTKNVSIPDAVAALFEAVSLLHRKTKG